MSAGQRLAILAVAAIVLVGGFLIAQGSGDDENDTASTPSTQTSADTSAGTETQQQEQQQPEGTSQPAAPRVETIRIAGGQNASGDVPELKYTKGDTVRLRYRSDQPVEVHLHGYDKAVEVPAGGTKTLTFKATAEGIFEIENEGTGTELAKLVVEP